MTLHDGLWFLAGAMSGCAVGILAMCVVAGVVDRMLDGPQT